MLAGPIFVTTKRHNVGGDRVEVTTLVGSILSPLILWTVPRRFAASAMGPRHACRRRQSTRGAALRRRSRGPRQTRRAFLPQFFNLAGRMRHNILILNCFTKIHRISLVPPASDEHLFIKKLESLSTHTTMRNLSLENFKLLWADIEDGGANCRPNRRDGKRIIDWPGRRLRSHR